MNKPHEEDWSAVKTGMGNSPYVEDDNGVVIAVLQVPYLERGAFIQPLRDLARQRARLIGAAPEVTRALLALVEVTEGHHDFTDPREADAYAALVRAKEALRKAGALP